MSDFISREAAIRALEFKCKILTARGGKTAADILARYGIGALKSISLPAADVRPVVHGRWEVCDWIEYDGYDECIHYPKEGLRCSNCKHVFKEKLLWKDNCCPNCGADMTKKSPVHKEPAPKVKVYGYSDDLVAIEGSRYKENEIDCFEQDVRIRFADGTIIRVGYSKPDMAVWYIIIEKKGTAVQTLTICHDEDAEVYSDVFEIDAEVLSHEVVSRYDFQKGGKQP